MLSPVIVAILEFREVSKTYGRQSRSHPALADVTFSIEPGELTLILGPSGAGKSTVLKLILALERPDQGAVALAGREIHRLTRGSIPYLRRNVGVVFQDFKLISEATPLENVCLALEVSGLSPQVLKAKAQVALAELSLDPNCSTPVRRLSGGEQQRVALARALAVEPAILLADEATGNLDPLLSREVFRQFERVCANGTTVLFASHSPMVHSQLQWTRMLRLEAGRLVDDNYRARSTKKEENTPRVIHSIPSPQLQPKIGVVA